MGDSAWCKQCEDGTIEGLCRSKSAGGTCQFRQAQTPGKRHAKKSHPSTFVFSGEVRALSDVEGGTNLFLGYSVKGSREKAAWRERRDTAKPDCTVRILVQNAVQEQLTVRLAPGQVLEVSVHLEEAAPPYLQRDLVADQITFLSAQARPLAVEPEPVDAIEKVAPVREVFAPQTPMERLERVERAATLAREALRQTADLDLKDPTKNALRDAALAELDYLLGPTTT